MTVCAVIDAEGKIVNTIMAEPTDKPPEGCRLTQIDTPEFRQFNDGPLNKQPDGTNAELFSELKQRMTTYTFPTAGCEIPLHQHPQFRHIALCLRGKCEIFNERDDKTYIEPFEYREFAINEPHGLRAVEDNTVMLTLREPLQR